MLDPKKDKPGERKAAPASAAPVVEPGTFRPMTPEVPVGKRATIAESPREVESSQPKTGAEGYRMVFRCRTKRGPD